MTNIYRLALQVQDASNIQGVIRSLQTEILPAIRLEAGYTEQGTSYVAEHPAVLLFLDKLVSLTHAGFIHDFDLKISNAYTECAVKAEQYEQRQACIGKERGTVICVDSEDAIRARIVARSEGK